MENLYQQALLSFQQNNFEKAIEYLKQCEPSSQVDMLYRECIKGAKSQYSYIINEAQRTNDKLALNEYVHKYVNVVGQDDYILQFVSSKVGGNVDESSGLVKMDQWLSGTVDTFLFPNIKKILIVGFALSFSLSFLRELHEVREILYALGDVAVYVYSLFITLTNVVAGLSLTYFIVRTNRITLDLQSICYGCLLLNAVLNFYLWYYTNLHEFTNGEELYVFYIGALNNILALSAMLISYIKGKNIVSQKWVIPFLILYHLLGLVVDLCIIMEFDTGGTLVYIGWFTILLGVIYMFTSIYKANDIISAYEGCNPQSEMLGDNAEPWYNQDVAGISLKNILIIIVGFVAIVGGIIYLTGNQNKIAQAPEIDTSTVYTEEQEELQIEENASPDSSLDNFVERLAGENQFVYKDYNTHYVFFINSEKRLMAYSSYKDKMFDVDETLDQQMDYTVVENYSVCPDGNGFLLGVNHGGNYALEGLYHIHPDLSCTCLTSYSLVEKLQDGYVAKECLNYYEARSDDNIDYVYKETYYDFNGKIIKMVDPRI